MPRSVSGSYSLVSGNPVTTGTIIDATWANNTLADIAAALSDSLSRTGNGGMQANLSLDGNLQLTGTARRITGDFSNSTQTSRTLFQSSTADGITNVGAIPNGAGTQTAFTAFGSSDPTNASAGQMLNNNTEVRFSSTITGTGTYVPMTFFTGGSERARIDTSGNLTVTSPAGLGYGTGAGGTVVQATSKSTTVTLNKPCGRITMNNAALAASTSAFFAVTNSVVGAYDTVLLAIDPNTVTNAGNYALSLHWLWPGQFAVKLQNISAGSLSEAVGINFAIVKGANA